MNRSAQLEKQALIVVAIRMRKVARQRREVLVDQRELKGHGPRIGFIREQQVRHGVGFEVRHVSAAIGERAVADFQNGFEQHRIRPGSTSASRKNCETNAARSMRRPMSRNRHAWPRVIESDASPANAARGYDQIVEQFEDAGRRAPFGPALKLKTRAINFLQDAPGIRGNGVAQDSGQAVKIGDAASQALALCFAEHRFDKFAFEFRARRTNRLAPASRSQDLNGMSAVKAGLIDHARDGSPREASLRVGALRVASQPEEVFRQAAGQIAAAAADGDGLGRRREKRHRADGAVRQNPGVLAAASFLQGHDQRVVRLRDARKPAVHHRVGIAIRAEIGANDEAPRLNLFADERGSRAGHDLFLRHVIGLDAP